MARRIPEVVIKRLPVYLRVLNDLVRKDVEIISSAELAHHTGFSSEQIRKDLAYFGAFGTRGVGYNTRTLSEKIKGILGLDREVPVVLVGAGNLGTALARYSMNKHEDVRIVAVFDNDWDKIGKKIEDVEIKPMEDLEEVIKETGAKMAIITVPAVAAQEVAEKLEKAGIESILNFSPAKLSVGEGVYLQNIDLTIELQSLAFYTSNNEG